MNGTHRTLVLLFALLFALVGLAFWIAPEPTALAFGVDTVRGGGLAQLSADFGGLFVGLALLTGVGALCRRRDALVAAAAVLAAVAAGRLLGLVFAEPAGVAELVIELAGVAVLTVAARSAGRASGAFEGVPMRPIAIGLGVLAALAVAGSLVMRAPGVAQSLFDRAATQMSARTNGAPLADDALRVAVCGSSAPLPSADRAKACVAVFAGGRFWIVDSGPESTENLLLWGIPMSEVGGVLLTHFHSDHLGDLGELQLQTWAGGRREPLAVYGGPGVEGVVEGFNLAYRLDQGYRTAHHGESVMPSAAWGMKAHTVELEGPPTPAKDRSARVYDDGVLRITALEVDHAPIEPSYAYRFDYRGRSVVVTGDLKYHRPLVDGARDADLLVSEAISRTMTKSLEDAAHAVARDRTAAIMHDVQDYHISPEEAATIANDAGVGLLVYYHLLPAPDGALPRRLFAQGVDAVRPTDWTIADDGSLYTLPLGSEAIQIGRIDG